MGKNRRSNESGTNTSQQFQGELNTNDERNLPLENGNYNSLEEFYEASDETNSDGFNGFKTHNATHLINDWTYSNQEKQALKQVADDYEKEHPNKKLGSKDVLKRTRFLKQYRDLEFAPGQKLDVNSLKPNFKLELERRGYSYSDNYTNKYYYENGRIYTAKFNN